MAWPEGTGVAARSRSPLLGGYQRALATRVLPTDRRVIMLQFLAERRRRRALVYMRGGRNSPVKLASPLCPFSFMRLQ